MGWECREKEILDFGFSDISNCLRNLVQIGSLEEKLFQILTKLSVPRLKSNPKNVLTFNRLSTRSGASTPRKRTSKPLFTKMRVAYKSGSSKKMLISSRRQKQLRKLKESNKSFEKGTISSPPKFRKSSSFLIPALD